MICWRASGKKARCLALMQLQYALSLFHFQKYLGFYVGEGGGFFLCGRTDRVDNEEHKGFWFWVSGEQSLHTAEWTAVPFWIKWASNRKHIFPSRFVCISMFAQLVSMVSRALWVLRTPVVSIGLWLCGTAIRLNKQCPSGAPCRLVQVLLCWAQWDTRLITVWRLADLHTRRPLFLALCLNIMSVAHTSVLCACFKLLWWYAIQRYLLYLFSLFCRKQTVRFMADEKHLDWYLLFPISNHVKHMTYYKCEQGYGLSVRQSWNRSGKLWYICCK